MVLALLPATSSPAAAIITTLQVNTQDDFDADDPRNECTDSTPGTCSLRAAVQEANTAAFITNIVLDSGTYVLTIEDDGDANTDPAASGSLTVTASDLIITGAGTGETILDGAGTEGLRLPFFVVVSDADVQVQDLTMTGGSTADGTPSGAAARVEADGHLHLHRVEVSDNTSAGSGGALYVDHGTLTVTQSHLHSNTSVANSGGALSVTGSTAILEMSDSSVTANTARAGGGGIDVNGEDVLATIERSTFSNNDARRGGGLSVSNNAEATLTNSTISGNGTLPGTDDNPPTGAGIFTQSGTTVTLQSTTVAGNTIDRSEVPAAEGDGLSAANSGAFVLRSSIIANNGEQDCYRSASGTFTSEGHNLDGDGTCELDDDLDDIVEGDARLDPLADNGGPTQTHRLLSDSDAIGMGSGNGPTVDQRGVSRPQGDGPDIGAYEVAEAANGGGCALRWTGAIDDDWATPGNWIVPSGAPAARAPGSGDVVCIDDDTNLPVILDGADSTIAQLNNSADVGENLGVRLLDGTLTLTDDSELEHLGIALSGNNAELMVEGDLDIGGVSAFEQGTLSGAGETTFTGDLNVAEPGSKTISEHTVVLAGDTMMTSTNPVRLEGGSSVTNTGTIDFDTTGGFSQVTSQTDNILRNDGTLRRAVDATPATSTLITATLENGPDGVIELAQPLTLQAGGFNEGTISINGATALGRFNMSGADRTFRMEPGSRLETFSADVWVQAGDLVLATEDVSMDATSRLSPQLSGQLTVEADISIGSLSLGGRGLRGSHDVTVTSTGFWGGGTIAGEPGTELLVDTDLALVGGNITRTLEAGRTVVVTGDLADTHATSSDSRGTFTIEDGGVMQVEGEYDHRSDLLIVDGTLEVGSHTIAEDGRVTGAGAIIGPVANEGFIGPGSSPGTLSIDDDYSQSSDGELEIEIAGTASGEFDLLEIAGDAELDGTLTVELLDGFVPTDGDEFIILTAADVDGTFATVELPDLDGNTPLTVIYDSTEVRLLVGAADADVPADEEPSEEVPADDIPSDEAPTDEPPSEEPTEETPVEETPIEETPIEEVLAEEEPTAADADVQLARTGMPLPGLLALSLLALLLGTALTLLRRRTDGSRAA